MWLKLTKEVNKVTVSNWIKCTKINTSANVYMCYMYSCVISFVVMMVFKLRKILLKIGQRMFKNPHSQAQIHCWCQCQQMIHWTASLHFSSLVPVFGNWDQLEQADPWMPLAFFWGGKVSTVNNLIIILIIGIGSCTIGLWLINIP